MAALEEVIKVIKRRLLEEERIYFYETGEGKYEVRDVRVNDKDLLSKPTIFNRYMQFNDAHGLVHKYHHNTESYDEMIPHMSAEEVRRVVTLYALGEIEYQEKKREIIAYLTK